MKIFSALYGWMMVWSRHRHAPYYLFGLSFAESSVFPIPPDVMLAPMALARPQQAMFYALITTIASVLGGIFGYLIGMFCFAFVHPWIIQLGYEPTFMQIDLWFKVWGFWIIFIAGFSPIPYKLFTIAAGVMGMALIPFMLASFVGRGGRFFLVSGLMLWGGARMEQALKLYIDRLGWGLLVVLVLAYLMLHYEHLGRWIGLI